MVIYLYYNINIKNEIIKDKPDITFCKKELLNKFQEFIYISGYFIMKKSNLSSVPYDIYISNGKYNYRMLMYFKNITGSGWSNKPNIRRVQVSNVRNDDIDKYINTTDNSFLVILGYYNFDNNPIMVAWNAYNYVYHNTQRSCYIDIDSLQKGYNNGYYKTICSNQSVWIFTPTYFEKFIEDYIKTNKVI